LNNRGFTHPNTYFANHHHHQEDQSKEGGKNEDEEEKGEIEMYSS